MSYPAGRVRAVRSQSDLGYVYLIRYSNGVVKGGRTRNPGQRLRTLETNGARLNLQVTHTWTSVPLSDVNGNERMLLRLLKSLGPRTPGGLEYFLHVPFTVAKSRMENLLKPGRHYYGCECRSCFTKNVFAIPATVTQISQSMGERGDYLTVEAELLLPCGGCLDVDIFDYDVTHGRLVLNAGDQVVLEIEQFGNSWTAWAVTSGGAYAEVPVLAEK